MIRHCKYFFMLGLLLLLTLTFGKQASAKTVISDSASMLTSGETETLRKYCDNILEQYDTSIYIVTSDTIGMNDNFEGYMEQIGNAADAPEDMVLLFVSIKEGGRVYQIFGYGKAETYLTHERCNKIMDHMQKDLSNKEYLSALTTFCEETQRYLGCHPRFDSFIFLALPQFGISLLLSILVIFLMLHSSTGRNSTTVNNYIDNSHSRLLGHIDHFTHMSVSRVKRSSNSSSSGGGGGGRSHSSGTPHSF